MTPPAPRSGRAHLGPRVHDHPAVAHDPCVVGDGRELRARAQARMALQAVDQGGEPFGVGAPNRLMPVADIDLRGSDDSGGDPGEESERGRAPLPAQQVGRHGGNRLAPLLRRAGPSTTVQELVDVMGEGGAGQSQCLMYVRAGPDLRQLCPASPATAAESDKVQMRRRVEPARIGGGSEQDADGVPVARGQAHRGPLLLARTRPGAAQGRAAGARHQPGRP